MDAGRDVGLADVPEGLDGGPDTGRDAPMLDGGSDAGFDGGVDSGMPDSGVDSGMPDTGVDAPPPRTCAGRFGTVPGYVECAAAPGLCRFYADPTDPTSCATFCGLAPGGSCVGVVDDMGVACATMAGGIGGGCVMAFSHMVCTCTLGS